MYSPKIVESGVAHVERELGIKLVRYSVDDSLSRTEDLAKLYTDKGTLLRALTSDEKDFIRNERHLTRLDFRYWLERYCKCLQDQGGLDHVVPWESQNIILKKIADLEEKMAEHHRKRETCDGILIVLNKARQLGATLIGRAITVHRVTTVKHTRAIGASLDDDKILELYDRDKVILDNLPWWLKPSIGFDEKAQHIHFDKLVSRVLYQTSNQKFGVGQGRQFDVGHLTECASWPNPLEIEHNYLPTIPQSIRAFTLWESTPQGRGNWWHDLTKRIRNGQSRRLHYLFIPYYVEKSKYNATPPPDWKPSELAMKHAQMVYETSPEYTGGKGVMLSRQKLYWWESTRAEYQAANSLNLFYSNYAANVEESFQFSTQSAFGFEYIENARLDAANARSLAYEIRA